MKVRWLLASVLMAPLFVGCSDGEGSPKARVANGYNTVKYCIIEAAWKDDASKMDFGWGYPITTAGQTDDREVVEGSGYAYALAVELAYADTDAGTPDMPACKDFAEKDSVITKPLVLLVTRGTQAMKPGSTTTITFSEATSQLADSEPAKTEAWGLFERYRLAHAAK